MRYHVSIRLNDVRDYWNNRWPLGFSDSSRYDLPSTNNSTSGSGRSWREISSREGSGTWATSSLQHKEQQQPLLSSSIINNNGSTDALITGNAMQQQRYFPTSDLLSPRASRSNSPFVPAVSSPHHIIVYEDNLHNNTNTTTTHTNTTSTFNLNAPTRNDPTFINNTTASSTTNDTPPPPSSSVASLMSPQSHLQAYTMATLVTPNTNTNNSTNTNATTVAASNNPITAIPIDDDIA